MVNAINIHKLTKPNTALAPGNVSYQAMIDLAKQFKHRLEQIDADYLELGTMLSFDTPMRYSPLHDCQVYALICLATQIKGDVPSISISLQFFDTEENRIGGKVQVGIQQVSNDFFHVSTEQSDSGVVILERIAGAKIVDSVLWQCDAICLEIVNEMLLF